MNSCPGISGRVSSMIASYSPGGSVSIMSSALTSSLVSRLATPADTKMPRWPTFSCSAIHDGLVVEADVLDAAVDVGDPVERLLGRRDVVAPRREHDDGRADVADVDAVLAVERFDLAGG